MRDLIPVFTVLSLIGLANPSLAVDLTLDSPSVNAGSSVAVNVVWSSLTPIKSLTTEFIITLNGGGSTSGEVTFAATAGVPAVPPINASNYLFSGDSFSFLSTPPINPASVYATTWSNDTYLMTDFTDSNTDYSQDGTRIWTILNIDTTGLAAGQYQITMGPSSYDSGSSVGVIPTFTGGLITINAVPEPSTWAMAGIGAILIATLAHKRL